MIRLGAIFVMTLLLTWILLPVDEPIVGQAVAVQTFECEQDVIVQADDWLSKLAEKFLGDPRAYPAIVEATNANAHVDGTYATIQDANIIEPGWKICIPKVSEGRVLSSDQLDTSSFKVAAPSVIEHNGLAFFWTWEGENSLSDENLWYFDIKIFDNAFAPFPYEVFVAKPSNTQFKDGVWSFDGTLNFRCGSHWAIQIAKQNPDGSYVGPLSPESVRLPIGPACPDGRISSPISGP